MVDSMRNEVKSGSRRGWRW